MNILQINKFYHIIGGVDRYFFKVSKLLKKYSHQVAFFSMRHNINRTTRWKKYFVSNVSFQKNSITDRMRYLIRVFYSREARTKIAKLVDAFNPDIVHLHAIYHHISPSILPELKKSNIPIVQSLGDYHLIAPNYNLYHNGNICEITKPDKFYKALFHRCVKNSYIASFIEIAEKNFLETVRWEKDLVDYFLARSNFLKNKLIEYGISDSKIVHLPHFIDSHQYLPDYDSGKYILYFGRLSPEKGLDFLIEVMKGLPKISLVIAGKGVQNYELNLKKKAENVGNVKFIGFLDGYMLNRIIRNSRFTILPSVWYEVFGLSMLESFASGKPVIASNIGGIPETVKHGYNGLLFEPKNIDDLTDKITLLWSNLKLSRSMGKNARKYVEENHNPADHYEKLMAIYQKAIRIHR